MLYDYFFPSKSEEQNEYKERKQLEKESTFIQKALATPKWWPPDLFVSRLMSINDKLANVEDNLYIIQARSRSGLNMRMGLPIYQGSGADWIETPELDKLINKYIEAEKYSTDSDIRPSDNDKLIICWMVTQDPEYFDLLAKSVKSKSINIISRCTAGWAIKSLINQYPKSVPKYLKSVENVINEEFLDEMEVHEQ